MMRTRWAAIGAAVAVTLGAGGIGLVSATSPSDAVTYVPIEPCRLFDTRPEFQVGARDTPLQPDETYTVAAHGDNGQCTNIPDNATGLGMNVTADEPTQETVLTFWGDGPRPNASSLNPAPGEPPLPNAVTSRITSDGELKIWNAFGTVHVLADVVGYYVDHDHDDRYYTEAEVDAALATKPSETDVYTKDQVYTKDEVDTALDTKADAADVYTQAEVDAAVIAAIESSQSIAVSDTGDETFFSGIDPGPFTLASATITPPVDGKVIVNSTAQVFSSNATGPAKGTARCSITTGGVVETTELQQIELIAEDYTGSPVSTAGAIAGTRTIVSAADTELTINLICEGTDISGTLEIDFPRLTAIFVPD